VVPKGGKILTWRPSGKTDGLRSTCSFFVMHCFGSSGLSAYFFGVWEDQAGFFASAVILIGRSSLFRYSLRLGTLVS
jgi:hypothetical protein